jgi:hypothetical protein
MSWDVAIFADVRFPPGGIERWNALVADKAAFTDWEGDFTSATAPENALARPVSEVIADLEGAGEELLRFEVSGDIARLRAMLPKDSYYDWSPAIATIFRVAAQAGGQGDIYFVGYLTIQFGYRFRIQNGRAVFETMDGDAIAAAEETAGYREVDEMAQERSREILRNGGAAST